MLFHNWVFLLFFAIVYPVYLLTKHTRFRTVWLLGASYVFYGWWNALFLLLILYSTTVDYLAVLAMSRWGRKKQFLFISVVNNLGLLGFYKYAGFVTENVNAVLGHWGVAYTVPDPGVLLPVGISFFVFQSMSYTIDFYRGQVEKEPNFLRYATFVSLFPQLVAGPIERARNLLPQLQQTQRVTWQDVTDGLSLFAVGFFKKVALADFLATYVDEVYLMPDTYQAPALLLATFAFAWQIYFDFSGYTDMARGVARMMGFRLMLNFNNPYLATGLGDFWGRWHISLSTWFKDYVYIPLGGNRHGTFRTYVNMFLTMVISGLWHGAKWTFIVWGALHALGRVVTRELERTAFYRECVPRCVKQALVFVFVCFCWVFFRADTFSDACTIVGRIFTSGWADPKCPLLMLGLVGSVWVYQFVYESRLRRLVDCAPVRVALVVAMFLYVAVFATSSNQAFIYFQF
ncbi:MAG TPA: MBOAT family protein [Candidatus Hydrogenedentes bacterium]|nr:MBOAT family protein [Candidatus Hydrogenedentota bacterium]HPG67605.1 MBOAT family protein [Candidatus Hydrogenedentota bacterium]